MVTGPGAVLLTDAPANATLAAARALGRRGLRVGVCTFEGEFNLAAHSRYVAERVPLPSPATAPAEFAAGLARACRAGNYAAVFPTTERTMQVVSDHRDELPAGVALPIPDREAVETARDKGLTADLARSVGVPVPTTWWPADAAEVARLAPTLPYPVIVKPRQTNFAGADGRLVKAGYAFVRTAAALPAAHAKIDAAVPRPLIQEVVPGIGAGVFSLWNHGTPLLWFAHRRVREEDPRGGRASAAITVPVDPRLAEQATRLLKALRWHGVAMVEFKRHAATGACWLMEINGRFWGSLALAIAAGVDFPYHLYQVAQGEAVTASAGYPSGVLARDAVGELKHFLRVMRGPRREFLAHAPGRLETLAQAPTILHPWRHAYNWTADDPEPGRREWLRAVRSLLGRGRR
jgi:predicted ATP-grasp superfamily ATP-dependent carboligase